MPDAEAEYRHKTTVSAKIFARSRRLHVNGVHHNIRFFEPYPFVTRSAGGRHLVDVDSNRYVDYWMGHWSMILGHAPAPVRAAVRAQIADGWMHGTVSEPTMRLSAALQKSVRAAEKIRYVTSGTEAVMYAARLARSRTGRRTIAKIDGGWHGYASDLLKSVNWPFDVAEGSGLAGAENVVSVPYNDLEGSLDALRGVRKDLACIVAEPLLGGACVPAEPDYMRGIQEFARSSGALLVLDEIVTGFRFRFGCAYPEMRLDPDIVALGKIIGGGFPIGAVCGRKEIMGLSDTGPGGPARADRSYIGGGTFSANPASMSAGAATLDELRSGRGSIYPKIARLGEEARRGLARAFDGKAAVTGKGSLFMAHFLRDGVHEVRGGADAARCDADMLRRYHFELIAREGIFFLPSKMGAASAAHTRGDIRSLVRASERFSASAP